MALLVELQSTANGIVLPVQAQAGARKNGITGVHAGRLKVAVTQAPEKGKANQAIIKLLADLLAVKRSQISLLAGETSPQKRFLISEISLEELSRQIATLVPPS